MVQINLSNFIPFILGGALLFIHNMAALLPGTAPAAVPLPHGPLTLASSSNWNMAIDMLLEEPMFDLVDRFPNLPLNGGPATNAVHGMLSSGVNNTKLLCLAIDNRTLTKASSTTSCPWVTDPYVHRNLTHLQPFERDIGVNAFYQSGITFNLSSYTTYFLLFALISSYHLVYIYRYHYF